MFLLTGDSSAGKSHMVAKLDFIKLEPGPYMMGRGLKFMLFKITNGTYLRGRFRFSGTILHIKGSLLIFLCMCIRKRKLYLRLLPDLTT